MFLYHLLHLKSYLSQTGRRSDEEKKPVMEWDNATPDDGVAIFPLLALWSQFVATLLQFCCKIVWFLTRIALMIFNSIYLTTESKLLWVFAAKLQWMFNENHDDDTKQAALAISSDARLSTELNMILKALGVLASHQAKYMLSTNTF